MFPAPRPLPDPKELSRPTPAVSPVRVVPQAHSEDTKALAHPVNEVSSALRIGAALRAAYHDNFEGQLPGAQEHAEPSTAQRVHKPPTEIASDEKALREDLLANDSLGG